MAAALHYFLKPLNLAKAVTSCVMKWEELQHPFIYIVALQKRNRTK